MRKNVYVPDDKEQLWNKLEEIGEKKDRSVSYLVNEAIEKYISKHKED